MLNTVLVCYCPWNYLSQTQWLKTTQIYYYTDLCLKYAGRAVWFWKVPRENPSLWKLLMNAHCPWLLDSPSSSVKSNIALTSASTPPSPLTPTLLCPSYEELCDYPIDWIIQNDTPISRSHLQRLVLSCRVAYIFWNCHMDIFGAINYLTTKLTWVPWWLSGKELICQFRRLKRHGFDPSVGKIPWRQKWQPTIVFLPGESHGQRSLGVYSPWGCKELDTGEVT